MRCWRRTSSPPRSSLTSLDVSTDSHQCCSVCSGRPGRPLCPINFQKDDRSGKRPSKNVPFKRIKVGNGQHAQVEGIGDVSLSVKDDSTGTMVKINLRNVLYIPSVPVNLISTRCLYDDDNIQSLMGETCTIHFPNGTKSVFKTYENCKHQ